MTHLEFRNAPGRCAALRCYCLLFLFLAGSAVCIEPAFGLELDTVESQGVTFDPETKTLRWKPVDGAKGYIVYLTKEGEREPTGLFLVESNEAALTAPTGAWKVGVMPLVCDDYEISAREGFEGPSARLGATAELSFTIAKDIEGGPAVAGAVKPIGVDALISSADNLTDKLLVLEARRPFEFSHEQLAADFKEMSGWPRYVILSGEKQGVPVLTRQLLASEPGDLVSAVVQLKRRAKGGYGIVGLAVEFRHPTLVEKLLEQLRQGYGVFLNGEEYGGSPRKLVSLNKKQIQNPQGMFDELLERVPDLRESRQICGGLWLAMKLDRSFLDKKRENQVRLVELLAASLTNTKLADSTFLQDRWIVEALASDQFEGPGVFSDAARAAIRRTVSEDARIIRALADPTRYQRNFAMLAAKAFERDDAVKVIEELRQKAPNAEITCAAYLAKLGVPKEQQELVARFKRTKDMRQKFLLAYALAIWGDRPAQEALAEALRTPGFALAADGRPREIISLHIAVALVRTVPEKEKKGLPNKSRLHMWTEEDMAKVEAWAVKQFGTTWTAPRPEFQPAPNLTHF